MIQPFAGKIFHYCSCPFSEPRMHQSQNFVLQIGLELMMDRDPLHEKKPREDRDPLLTACCTHTVPLRLTFARLRFFNAGCVPDNLPSWQEISRGLRSRLLPQYHSLTRSSANAEEPCEHAVSWNRVKCCTNVRRIAFEKACNRWVTFKVIQGHYRCCHLIGHDRPCTISY